jgi:putative spermidine/putrescine transport system substrate-binding protein
MAMIEAALEKTRRAAWILAGVSLLAGLASPAKAQVNQDIKGEINIIGFSSVFEDIYTNFVIKPFMAKYPNVKVNYRPMRNSAESVALLRVQKSRPTIDVALMDIAVAMQANKDGLFAALDPAKVPSLADIPEWGRAAGNFGPAMSQDNLSIIYNTSEIKVAPSSWNDLSNPAYKGRVGMPIADTRGVLLIPLLARMQGADYKTNIDPAIEALKKIAPLVQTYEPVPDVYTAVQSGSIGIAVGWNGRGQYVHDTQGEKIAVAIPKEGSIAQINTVNLVAGAPNPDAAQAFINYALGEEAQKAFAEKSFYGPVNSKVKLSPEVQLRIFGDTEASKRQMHLDWSFITERYSAWVQRIKREVMGGS